MLDEISSNMNQKVAAVNEADLFTYSAFTYEKLFSPSSDIYHRNVVKLSGMRKSELQKVVAKSLEYLNAKPNRNFSLSDFQIGFTRSTPSSTGTTPRTAAARHPSTTARP